MKEVRDATTANRLAQRWERAQKLEAEGYRFEPALDYWTRKGVPGMGANDMYACWTPAGKMYVVDVFRATCDCEDFRAHGDFCKHLLKATALYGERAKSRDAEQYED
jgi:hypothetical protein